MPLLLVLFALHTFLLMGTGTWSDLATAGEAYGLMLYYAREGMLAVGFLLYAAFARWRKTHPLHPKSADILGVAMVALFAVSIFSTQVSNLQVVRVPAVLTCALLIGLSGGLTYERIAQIACHHAKRSCPPLPHDDGATRMLGPVIGGGGALAVALQYVLQTRSSAGVWLDVLFVVTFGLVVWLARRVRSLSQQPQTDAALDAHVSAGSDLGDKTDHKESGDSDGASFTTVMCLVVAASCLFALLPFYEAFIRASSAGTAAFYEWHRLFLAAGYLVMGAASHLGGRRAASVTMLVSALFAITVLVQTLVLGPSSLTMVLFYFLLAATIAWSNTAFMTLSARTGRPALVASAGRVLLVLVTLTEIPIQALGKLPLLPMLTIELVLFATAMVSMLRGGFLDKATIADVADEPPEEEPAPSLEDRAQMLGSECDLSDRELEVLAALVLSEDKNQKIADDLGISRRQLQTYVSRIYEKTGTTTRAGLVLRMYGDVQHR